jgi:hypothetical protein
MSRFKPQLDKPKDGFGPCRFVALFSCPGVHTFTQFGRETDGRYGIMPGGATAFLCTRGHMLPFLFTFIIYRPSGVCPMGGFGLFRARCSRRSRHSREVLALTWAS